MAVLWARKSKQGITYYVTFYYRGRRHKISTGTSDLKLARPILAEIERKVVLGEFNIDDYSRKAITIREYRDVYFQNVTGTKKESTIEAERLYYRTFGRIVGENLHLHSLDLQVLEKWRSARLANVQPTTYNIERAALSSIFGKAVEYGYLKENPFRMLKRIRVEEQRLYMTVEEESQFLSVLDQLIEGSPNRKYTRGYFLFKLFFAFQLDTGMRRDETISLGWNQIDLNRRVIMVERTKGKRRREIPMTRRVEHIVRELGESLFHELSGDQVSRKYSLIARKAQLPSFLSQHSLRHTFATRLIALGIDISVVSRLLGHASIETTMIYAKATPETLRGAIESLDDFEEAKKRGANLGTAVTSERKLLGK